MSEVQFDEETGQPMHYGYAYRSRPTDQLVQGPTFYRRLMKWGIVRNEKQASHVVFGFAIFCFVSSFVIFYFRTRSAASIRYYITPEVLTRLPPNIQAQIKQAQYQYPANR